jgi:hypothetical protein
MISGGVAASLAARNPEAGCALEDVRPDVTRECSPVAQPSLGDSDRVPAEPAQRLVADDVVVLLHVGEVQVAVVLETDLVRRQCAVEVAAAPQQLRNQLPLRLGKAPLAHQLVEAHLPGRLAAAGRELDDVEQLAAPVDLRRAEYGGAQQRPGRPPAPERLRNHGPSLLAVA